MCSARSGSSKTLGTTNLLIKAAEQAVSSKRKNSSDKPTTPGAYIPLSNFWGGAPLRSSPPASPIRGRTNSHGGHESLLLTSISNTPQQFGPTVDLIKSEHLTAAREQIQDTLILEELEAEIESDCELLKAFLSAAQVGSSCWLYPAFDQTHDVLRSSTRSHQGLRIALLALVKNWHVNLSRLSFGIVYVVIKTQNHSLRAHLRFESRILIQNTSLWKV